jgi:hypothetical protein
MKHNTPNFRLFSTIQAFLASLLIACLPMTGNASMNNDDHEASKLEAPVLTVNENGQRYEIHYNVFNSSFISAKTAKQYQLERSAKSHLINISVRQLKTDSQTPPDQIPESTEINAVIAGSVNDLIRTDMLEFKKIEERDAIYYLAAFPIQYEQLIMFKIKVQIPHPKTGKPGPEHIIEFRRRLFPDQ